MRKTVVVTLVDKSGKKFELRFLIDSGATVSMILMQTLFQTKGEWDVGITPPIMMHGINSVSMCDMMLEATCLPGFHIPQEFKSQKGIKEDFGIKLQFYVQRGVKAYTCNKQELPKSVIEEITNLGLVLADPQQITPGEEKLYVHGIIGEDQISLFEECGTKKVGNAGLKLTESHFGHILHGNSHFMEANLAIDKPQMSRVACPSFQNSLYSISLFGLNVVASSLEEETDSRFGDINWLRDITS